MGKALVPFAFVYAPSMLFVQFQWGSFAVALVAAVVAIMGLGAAYTGHIGSPIGRPAFWLLHALSVSLVFAHPVVTAVAVLFFAETYATTSGLGYYIIVDSLSRLAYREMYAGVLAMSLLGLGLYLALDGLERRLAPWMFVS